MTGFFVWLGATPAWRAGSALTDLFDWQAIGAIGTFIGLVLVAQGAGREALMRRRRLAVIATDIHGALSESLAVIKDASAGGMVAMPGEVDPQNDWLKRQSEILTGVALDDLVALGLETRVSHARAIISQYTNYLDELRLGVVPSRVLVSDIQSLSQTIKSVEFVSEVQAGWHPTVLRAWHWLRGKYATYQRKRFFAK